MTPTSKPATAATFMVFSLMQEYHALNGRRFLWTSKIRDRIVNDWKTHFLALQQWSEKAQAMLQELSDEGQTELVALVAAKLLEQERVLDPASFSIGVKTGLGF